MTYLKVYRDKAGDWRWIRYASNGEEVSASTEGYENKAHAIEQARELNADIEDMRVDE